MELLPSYVFYHLLLRSYDKIGPLPRAKYSRIIGSLATMLGLVQEALAPTQTMSIQEARLGGFLKHTEADHLIDDLLCFVACLDAQIGVLLQVVQLVLADQLALKFLCHRG